MMGVIFDDGNLLIDKLVNVFHEITLFLRAKRKGRAFILGASGSTDTVNVGLGFVGNFEVDNVREFFDINPSCRDVGCDEDSRLPRLEVSQGVLPSVLCLVSVDGFGLDTSLIHKLREFVRSVFCTGEDKR